jgi:ribosomal protein S18 acetylase RimI-like enzyme
VHIRPADPEDAPALCRIARRAKAHWGYGPELLERWRGELSVTAESLRAAPTYVAEAAGAIAGFYQLSLDAMPPALEHLWVDPDRMGQGAGRALLRHAQDLLAARGSDELAIDADPHAEGFYLAMGAHRVAAVPAPVPGDAARVRPQLRLSTRA